MKYIIVLGDGMADEPIGKLGERTPLQAADTPAMDWLAAHGRCGLLKTVPDGYHPGSEIANLSVLGYDLDRVFEGRGSLEAASMGVDIESGEMAMRCNLVCIENGRIKNHSAGHISTAEGNGSSPRSRSCSDSRSSERVDIAFATDSAVASGQSEACRRR